MKVLDRLNRLFLLVSVLFILTVLAISFTSVKEASSLYLYELIGIFLTLMITFGGIFGMRKIT